MSGFIKQRLDLDRPAGAASVYIASVVLMCGVAGCSVPGASSGREVGMAVVSLDALSSGEQAMDNPDELAHGSMILPAGFTVHETRLAEGNAERPRLPYVVYSPQDIIKGMKAAPLPLIVFLHGSGESGTDGLKQVAQGLGMAVMRKRDRWPAIVLLPQKPLTEKLWPEYESQVLEAIKELRETLPIDASRIYLTGLSQGGHASWMLGAKNAELFAAIAPICGWASEGFEAGKLKDVPIWAFHGDADDAVNVKGTIDAAAQVTAAGGTAKTTIYPGVNHNSWDKAYADPELAKWMFEQRKTLK